MTRVEGERARLDVADVLAAQQAAAARHAAEQAAIAEIAYQALELHEAGDIAGACSRRVAETVDARYAAVMLLDENGVLRVGGVHGPDGEEWALHPGMPIDSGAPVTATQDGQAVVCSDMLGEVDKGMAPMARLLQVDSGIAVPIPGVDGARGVLTAARAGIGTFSLDDVGFLGAVAALLGTALGRLDTEAYLRQAAVHDSMTGLPNRILLEDRLEQALNRSRRDGSTIALMLLDLDDFKLVNDSFGHAAGDELLRALANRLAAATRPADTVARLGGDEFVLLCEGLAGDLDALTLAERLREAWSEPFDLRGTRLTISASIGLALSSAGGSTAEAMLRQADAAMYRAKSRGHDQTDVYDEEMRAQARRRLELESDLREAIDAGQFAVAYQPIFDLATEEMVAVEALLRWTHPTKGPQLPSEFVPVAEVTGLIGHIGAWVFTQACEQLAAWRDQFPQQRLAVTVNLSPVQLREAGLAETLLLVADSFGLQAGDVFVEITEGVLLDDSDVVTRNIALLAEEGIASILDDFGVGYSALSYVHRVPLASIKVDRSFVARLFDDRMAGAIIETVCTLAQRLGLSTVAEGIETPEQLERVRRLGCSRAQGFLLAEPMSPERVTNLLASRADRRP